MKIEIITSASPEETENAGKILAEKIISRNRCFTVLLYGDLGAGKTAFVRGFASVLSPSSKVKSPTYTIVNEYRRGDRPLYHFDLYRISSADDLEGIGFDEYISTGNCIIEWSENLFDYIDTDKSIKVTIEKTDGNERKITLAYPEEK